MATNNRKAIPKKIRFEVFKRDSFTCQYCGRMAPDVVLEVDHINPVAHGGNDDIMNLVTSCFDCNRGKGKKKLTEKDEIKKQQERLSELNSKREQLKLMLEWRNELENFSNEQLEDFLTVYSAKTGYSLTDHGEELAKKWIKEFGLIEVLDCFEISFSQYYKDESIASVEKVFNYIPRIAVTRKRQGSDAFYGKRRYIAAILRNRTGLPYTADETTALMEFLQEVVFNDESYGQILKISKTCADWSSFWRAAKDLKGAV